MVGMSMSVVNLIATLLAIGLLWLGCRQFRLSVAREANKTARAHVAEVLGDEDRTGATTAFETTRV
jgi:hypothetical protein